MAQELSDPPGATTVVSVVVVLFGVAPAASPALISLGRCAASFPGRLAVEVHDNSPDPGASRTVPGLDVISYHLHPDNPGLALPYNLALDAAERRGSAWLVLLDQDTHVTAEYLEEVMERVDSGTLGSRRVGAVVPRLVQDGTTLSPHEPLRIWPRILGPGVHQPSTRYGFLNSGCVISVAAAREVGGFPEDYPLDYLDHAMAALLRRGGYSLGVLGSCLEHDLSVRHMASIDPFRLRAFLATEERFHVTAPMRDRFWLLARRAPRAALVLARLRTSPDRALEIAAAGRAALLLLHRRGGRP